MSLTRQYRFKDDPNRVMYWHGTRRRWCDTRDVNAASTVTMTAETCRALVDRGVLEEVPNVVRVELDQSTAEFLLGVANNREATAQYAGPRGTWALIRDELKVALQSPGSDDAEPTVTVDWKTGDYEVTATGEGSRCTVRGGSASALPPEVSHVGGWGRAYAGDGRYVKATVTWHGGDDWRVVVEGNVARDNVSVKKVLPR